MFRQMSPNKFFAAEKAKNKQNIDRLLRIRKITVITVMMIPTPMRIADVDANEDDNGNVDASDNADRDDGETDTKDDESPGDNNRNGKGEDKDTTQSTEAADCLAGKRLKR